MARKHDVKVGDTAEFTFEDNGQTSYGDVVKAGVTYVDVKWREGRTERIRFDKSYPKGLIFERPAQEEATAPTQEQLAAAHVPTSYLNTTGSGIRTYVGCSCGEGPKKMPQGGRTRANWYLAHARKLGLAVDNIAHAVVAPGYASEGLTWEQWTEKCGDARERMDPYALKTDLAAASTAVIRFEHNAALDRGAKGTTWRFDHIVGIEKSNRKWVVQITLLDGEGNPTRNTRQAYMAELETENYLPLAQVLLAQGVDFNAEATTTRMMGFDRTPWLDR